MSAPLLRFALPDRRPATLLLGDAATVLSVDDALVSSWDLAGRAYALVRESGTYRRGLDGGLLLKREARGAEPRLRQRLSAAGGSAILEAARVEAEAALAVLGEAAAARAGDPAVVREATLRLQRVSSMDADALARDAERFLAACGPIGILPPDQYLSIVVRVTEGCSWNECAFCSLYRQLPFRVKTEEQLSAHLAALREYFGVSIALRRSVFIGDANALCVAQQRLHPLLEQVAHQFPGRPLHAFVDAWTGARRTVAEWRTLADLGLRRVYVGLETGDPELLHWLGKPGEPADAVALVHALRAAGVSAGVIVLLGAGGSRFDAAHVEQTSHVVREMKLGRGDLLYFSELVEQPGVAYAAGAGVADLRPLDSEGCSIQRRAIEESLREAARNVRAATYDVRDFVY